VLPQVVAEYSDVSPADQHDEDSQVRLTPATHPCTTRTTSLPGMPRRTAPRPCESQAFASGNRSSTPWMSSESEGIAPPLLSEHPIDPSDKQLASQASNVPDVEDTDIEEHDELEDEADELPALDEPNPAPASHDIRPKDQEDHVAPTQIVATEEKAEEDSEAIGDDASNSAGDVTTPAARSIEAVQRKGLVRAAAVTTPGPTTLPVQPRKRLKPLGLSRGAEAASPVEAPDQPAPSTADSQAAPEPPQCTAEPGQLETDGCDGEEPQAPAPQRKRLKKLAASTPKVRTKKGRAHALLPPSCAGPRARAGEMTVCRSSCRRPTVGRCPRRS
jgi:hypothetical protein